MPGWIATLLVGGFTVLVNGLLTAYYYGRLSQTVDSHEKRLDKTETESNDQWYHINDIRESVGKIKGALKINGN